MTTPAEKDAMALEMLDRAASCVRTLYDRPDAAAYADRAAKEYTDAKDYLAARVASLEAELAAVRVDSVRLDWLEANEADVFRTMSSNEFAVQVSDDVHMKAAGYAPTLRAAIDAARGAG